MNLTPILVSSGKWWMKNKFGILILNILCLDSMGYLLSSGSLLWILNSGYLTLLFTKKLPKLILIDQHSLFFWVNELIPFPSLFWLFTVEEQIIESKVERPMFRCNGASICLLHSNGWLKTTSYMGGKVNSRQLIDTAFSVYK